MIRPIRRRHLSSKRLKAARGMPFLISDDALHAMGQYKYCSAPNTRDIDKPTIDAITWAGKQIPAWIRPNWLTVGGISCAWGAYAILRTEYVPGGQTISSLGMFLMALGLFLYWTLDYVDGQHARRTNCCSILGLILDHGMDYTLVSAMYGIGNYFFGLPVHFHYVAYCSSVFCILFRELDFLGKGLYPEEVPQTLNGLLIGYCFACSFADRVLMPSHWLLYLIYMALDLGPNFMYLVTKVPAYSQQQLRWFGTIAVTLLAITVSQPVLADTPEEYWRGLEILLPATAHIMQKVMLCSMCTHTSHAPSASAAAADGGLMRWDVTALVPLPLIAIASVDFDLGRFLLWLLCFGYFAYIVVRSWRI